MTSPLGYNNPAYTHQFDSSLYDYQYVPEIDPEFEGQPSREQEHIHLVHPNFQDEFSGGSEEFEGSDESNQSVIVEECNNRRITLICEKRTKTNGKYYEDANCKGAYHHDISLESENDFVMSREGERTTEEVEKPRRRIDSNANGVGDCCDGSVHTLRSNRNPSVGDTNDNVIQYQTNQRLQRQHRYEEIIDADYNEEMNKRNRNQNISRHRYAEITADENGYPSIRNEIEIERDDNGYRIVNGDTQKEYVCKSIAKPRATSPVSASFSPTFSPGKTYQRTISPRPSDMVSPRVVATKPTPVPKSSTTQNSIEMAEMSPPRNVMHARFSQTQFLQSPKRHPPVGASSPIDVHEQMKTAAAAKHKPGKVSHKRQHSVTNFKEQPNIRTVTPSKSATKAAVAQIFQVRTTPKTPKRKPTSTRRNISSSFRDPPREKTSDFDFDAKITSPYRPTTAEVGKTRTAIITPILQRKNRRNEPEIAHDARTFQKMSQIFQSTGNLYRMAHPADDYRPTKASDATSNATRMKRNQSVPNFAQTLAYEAKSKYSRTGECDSSPAKRLDYQYSPAKSVERFSPFSRSRISLIDQTKLSWSNSGSDFQPPTSGCLLIAALMQIATSIASCAICFYLFSKLGRRYYLDFGILAGFVNFVLGVLGFRSQCWRWLPNRNYVSGYILLTAFSVLTCTGFTYLITARPMSGDPILDLMGGGICGISVLTIILSITGLTMSGCCKTPPPDNRVNNI